MRLLEGGDTVSDQARILLSIPVGALVGGMAAYLICTTHGRNTFAQVNPILDDVSHQLQEFRRALQRAKGIAHEAQRAAADVQAVLAGADLPADA